jgi:DNA polymerase III epsilon subunit-like protein
MPSFSYYHKIVQVCAYCLETGEIFEEFINPEMAGGIPVESTKIHNIRNEDVAGAQTVDVVLSRMYKFFNYDSYKEVVMIAHNNKYFDELMIRKEYEAIGITIPPNVVFWDSLPWLRRNFVGLTSYSLEPLYEYFFREKFSNAHRADADVRALARIYKEIIEPRIEDPLAVPTEEEEEAMAHKLIVDMVEADSLVNVRFIGGYRAYLIWHLTGASTVAELKRFARSFVEQGNTRGFDYWLIYTLNMRNITQRMFVVAAIMELPLWSSHLRDFLYIVADEDCLDDVDYYVKYRYVLNKRAPNRAMYYRGLEKVRLKIS